MRSVADVSAISSGSGGHKMKSKGASSTAKKDCDADCISCNADSIMNRWDITLKQ